MIKFVKKSSFIYLAFIARLIQEMEKLFHIVRAQFQTCHQRVIFRFALFSQRGRQKHAILLLPVLVFQQDKIFDSMENKHSDMLQFFDKRQSGAETIQMVKMNGQQPDESECNVLFDEKTSLGDPFNKKTPW